jgi:nitroreductase
LSIKALPFFQSIALAGQAAMHAPHAMHFDWFTVGGFDFFDAMSCLIYMSLNLLSFIIILKYSKKLKQECKEE